MARRLADIARQRAKVCDKTRKAALECFLRNSFSEVTIQSVADAMSVSYWTVYRQYKTKEALFRAAAEPLFETVASELRQSRMETSSVSGAIASCVRHASDVMLSHNYLEMSLLLIREGTNHPWLEICYRQKAIQPAAFRFDAAVRAAGDANGLIIGVQPKASERVVRMLETSLVLPRLLPGREPLSDAEVSAARQSAASALLAATYAVDFNEAAA